MIYDISIEIIQMNQNTVTYLKPEESLLPRSNTREPDQVEHFSIEVYVPSFVCYREAKRYGRMGFRHSALAVL